MLDDHGDFRPVLRFAVCSDAHLQSGRDEAAGRLARLMDLSYEYAAADPVYPGLDAFVFDGDMTDHGTREQYEAFAGVVRAHLKPGTRPLAVAAKNHDNWEFGRVCVKTGLGYLESVLGGTPDFHETIAGFHFIGLSTSRLDGEYYDEKQRQWLDRTLAEATADAPGKPVFVFHHEHVTGTVYGSRDEDGWGIPFFREVLEKYPNAVHFSGHSHYPLNDPRSVWRGAFTAVGVGALSYAELTVDGERYVHPEGYKQIAQGWLVEADDTGRLRMRGYDFLSGKLLCERRVPEGAHTERTKPAMPVGDAILYTIAPDRMIVSFPRAESAFGDPVCVYRVRLTDGERVLAETKTIPPYWLADLPERYEAVLPRRERPFGIEVAAEDAYGNQSEPLRRALPAPAVRPAFTRLPFSRFTGAGADAVAFVTEKQLLDTKLWADFIRVYGSDSDDADGGWRGEYWGKMMRGACLTYRYTGDERLYETLTAAVDGLLAQIRPDGSLSTYGAHPFTKWDMWCRKYVMTGLMHYLDVCRDEAKKRAVTDALCAHADAILRHVGPEEGKTDIRDTSDIWGSVNACSILEPFVDLYVLTGHRRYRDFAEYIISTGGCADGDLVRLAETGEKAPYEYPEQKAYETISFFEGLLAYYEATGEARYLEIVRRFARAVADTDVTVIGCCGCTHELFDHSALVQTEQRKGIMQETCVTVTWMRLLDRLYRLTGEAGYYEHFERSARNALAGALNRRMLEGVNGSGRRFAPLPFDSYSPLTLGRRNGEIGGLKEFDFGGFYGCCACIGAAGVALTPLTAVMRSADGYIFSAYETGEVRDSAVSFAIETPASAARFGARVRVKTAEPARLTLRFRVPEYAKNARLTVNGESCGTCGDGAIAVDRVWQSGDEAVFTGEVAPVFRRLNGKTCVEFGPFVLARDASKEPAGTDLAAPITLTGGYTVLPPMRDETLRVAFARAGGGPPLVMTDYASCGHDRFPGSVVSVWNDLTVGA